MLVSFRYAPSQHPSLIIKFYEKSRTTGSVGLCCGLTNTTGSNRTSWISWSKSGSTSYIVQANSAEIAEALCRYSAPEDLKPGGSISEKGRIISVRVINNNDLSHDVIKSDMAGVSIPELDFELASGTLSGIVTTVEASENGRALDINT